MRRRERWRNLAWLQKLNQAEGNMPSPPQDALVLPVADSLYMLVHDYRRYVEIELDKDIYLVRVLPALSTDATSFAPFGMAYTGFELRWVLSLALVELDLIASNQERPVLGATEKWRSVPCW